MTNPALFSSATDDWPTPQDFYDRLNAEFAFTLDVCSSTHNHKSTAFYALDHPEHSRRDGLTCDWATDAEAGTVWMNPPYGREIAHWMRKAVTSAQAGATVVCLVPVRSSSAWWHELVLATGAEVRYVRGRLTFGDAKTSAPFASAVVIYRPGDTAGQPGPAYTMGAKIGTGTPPTPSRHTGRTAAATVEERVSNYTPTSLSAEQWALAAAPVRSAALACNPKSSGAAGHLLTTLVTYLGHYSGWDKISVPNMDVLLSDERINAAYTAETLQKVGAPHRSIIRSLGRNIGATATAPRLRDTSKPASDPAVVALEDHPVPFTALVAAVATKRPGKVGAHWFRGVASEHARRRQATAPVGDVGTVSAAKASSALAEAADLKEVASRMNENTPTTKSAKPSRRAALRQAKQKAAARGKSGSTPAPAPPVVPAEIRSCVESFRPKKPATQVAWNNNRELAERLVCGYEPTSVRNAANVCSQVGQFLAWFVSSRPNTSPLSATDLTTELIEEFAASKSLADNSLATVRATMRRCLRSLAPSQAPRKVAYQPVGAPYTPSEVNRIIRIATDQPKQRGQANLGFIVGLALGAGLDTGDMRYLMGSSLVEASGSDGDPVLLVTVEKGPRPRVVPVRRRYESLVRGAWKLHYELGRTDDDLLVGKVPDRTNVGSWVISKARTAEAAPMEALISRMRNTWLVSVMCAPVPLKDLLAAAGLRSARTLTDLVAYCPLPDAADVQSALAVLDHVTPGQAAGGAQ